MAKNWPKGGALTERWRKPISKVADWVPVDALLAWIDTESGGQPQIVTNLGERGLFQVHPDEVSFLGLTNDEFQRLTTDTNLALRFGVKHLKLYAFQAKKVLSAVGEDWHGRDFWKLNKLFHGAFSMPSAAVNAFQRVNGRGPATWRELQAFALAEAAAGRDLVPGQTRQSAVLRALTPGVFANAEKTGEASEVPEYNRERVAVVGPLLRSFGLMV
jgi:hypothetical protein